MSDSGAEEYKSKGNAAFKEQNWDEAIKNYNKAITLDPSQASFYSNRAACWSSKGNHDSALSDSKRCLDADPDFVKGYSRKGKALFDMSRLDEAEAAYKDGIEKDANNPGCTQGLADVASARQRASQARRSTSSGGGGAFGGAFGGLSGMVQKLTGMMGGGRGGRMQMYAVVAIGYFLYNTFTKKSKAGSETQDASGHDTAEDDPVPAPSGAPMGQLRRSFTQVDGQWISFAEAGSRGSDGLLLLLHRTALSAEGEYGSLIDRVRDKAASPPAGGLRVLAPDRPCHGFTPCPASKPTTTESGGGWLEGLLSSRPKIKKLTIVASGRSAARQAFAVANERTQASRLLLVNPSEMGPGRGDLADSKAESAQLQEWLTGQQKAGVLSARAAADAARWAAAASAAEAEEEDDKLHLAGLPEGSQVTLLYGGGAKEDTDLKEELEGLGLAPRIRKAGDQGELEELLLSEAWRLAAGTEEEEENPEV